MIFDGRRLLSINEASLFGSQIVFTNDYDCENSILNASALPVSSL